MKRIIFHWTAGSYTPSAFEKSKYHYLIDNKGAIYNGFYTPKDNEDCKDNKYAAHTGGGNTASIGIAFCGMFGFLDRCNVGTYPLTLKQCEAGFSLAAELAKKYKLDLSNKLSVQTHYGFGKRNLNTTSKGKIDIIYLPPYPNVKIDNIENFIFTKVRWYFDKICQ